MNDLKIFENAVDENNQIRELPINELALIELTKITDKPIKRFKLVANEKSVCLVKFTCYGDCDPMMPIVLNAPDGFNQRLNALYVLLEQFNHIYSASFDYAKYTKQMKIIVKSIIKNADWLSTSESIELIHWLNMCVAMPQGWKHDS